MGIALGPSQVGSYLRAHCARGVRGVDPVGDWRAYERGGCANCEEYVRPWYGVVGRDDVSECRMAGTSFWWERHPRVFLHSLTPSLPLAGVRSPSAHH